MIKSLVKYFCGLESPTRNINPNASEADLSDLSLKHTSELIAQFTQWPECFHNFASMETPSPLELYDKLKGHKLRDLKSLAQSKSSNREARTVNRRRRRVFSAIIADKGKKMPQVLSTEEWTSELQGNQRKSDEENPARCEERANAHCKKKERLPPSLRTVGQQKFNWWYIWVKNNTRSLFAWADWRGSSWFLISSKYAAALLLTASDSHWGYGKR